MRHATNSPDPQFDIASVLRERKLAAARVLGEEPGAVEGD